MKLTIEEFDRQLLFKYFAFVYNDLAFKGGSKTTRRELRRIINKLTPESTVSHFKPKDRMLIVAFLVMAIDSLEKKKSLKEDQEEMLKSFTTLKEIFTPKEENESNSR